MKVSEAEKCPAFKATHIMFCAVQRVWKIALAFPVQVVDEHCNCACQLVRSALGSSRKRDHATAGSHTNITTLVFLDLWLCGKHPCATLTVTWGECDVTCNSWVGACCWSYLNADMFLVLVTVHCLSSIEKTLQYWTEKISMTSSTRRLDLLLISTDFKRSCSPLSLKRHVCRNSSLLMSIQAHFVRGKSCTKARNYEFKNEMSDT